MRPVSKEQWQDATDTAELLSRITTAQVLLFIELGRLFDLVDKNGELDIQACCDIIEDARSQGITPSTDFMHKFINDSSL